MRQYAHKYISVSFTIFDKCVKGIGMKGLKDLQGLGGEPLKRYPG
jgi:hypothetical protein